VYIWTELQSLANLRQRTVKAKAEREAWVGASQNQHLYSNGEALVGAPVALVWMPTTKWGRASSSELQHHYRVLIGPAHGLAHGLRTVDGRDIFDTGVT